MIFYTYIHIYVYIEYVYTHICIYVYIEHYMYTFLCACAHMCVYTCRIIWTKEESDEKRRLGGPACLSMETEPLQWPTQATTLSYVIPYYGAWQNS